MRTARGMDRWYTPGMHHALYKSPIGALEIVATESGIRSISISKNQSALSSLTSDHPHITECIEQLDDYFAGKRQAFSVKLESQGTPFQKQVWDALKTVSFATTASYGSVAAAIKKPSASRACGMACNRNPHLIIVPCHRIVSSNGLGGYAPGVAMKEWLLKHEQKCCKHQN